MLFPNLLRTGGVIQTFNALRRPIEGESPRPRPRQQAHEDGPCIVGLARRFRHAVAPFEEVLRDPRIIERGERKRPELFLDLGDMLSVVELTALAQAEKILAGLIACCARAANGQTAAEPTIALIKSRRRTH